MKTQEQTFEEQLSLVPPCGGEGTGDVLLGYDFHPDEPNQRLLAEYIEAHSIPGVRLYQFHPEAAAEGVRYLGSDGQLSRFFPGDVDSSHPEEAAAGAASAKITEIDPWLVPVLHDALSTSRVVVGPRTTRAALGLACKLGLAKIQVNHDSFARVVPRALDLEINAADKHLADPAWLHRKIRQASKLGEAGLGALFESCGDRLKYYNHLGAVSVAQTDPGLIKDLEELELHPGPFEKLTLPDDLLYSLVRSLRGEEAANKIQSEGLSVATNTWGYRNFSKTIPDQGDGIQRREYFGDLLLEGGDVSREGDIWVNIRSPLE